MNTKKDKNSRTSIDSLGNKGTFPSIRDESGAVLVIALLLMVVILALIPVAQRTTVTDLDRSGNYRESRTAFYIAEAGLEEAMGFVRNNNLDAILDGPDGDKTATNDNGTFVSTGTGYVGNAVLYNGNYYTQATFNGGTYYVRVYDNADEGVATGAGGDLPYEDKDFMVHIQAIGVYGDSTKTLNATVRRYNLPPSSFPAAVTTVGAGTPTVETGSNTFTVDGGVAGGDAYKIDGSTDTNCPSANGVATEQATSTLDETPPGSGSNISGDNGNTDIINGQNTYTAAKAQAFYEDTVGLADPADAAAIPIVANKYFIANNVDLSFGTSDSPIVLYLDKTVKISGSITGFGILHIDGDLDLVGTLNWSGVVMIGVCASCPAAGTTGSVLGSGNSTINGALVVGGDVKFNGNATINYSCEGIDKASEVLNQTFTQVGWYEEGGNI